MLIDVWVILPAVNVVLFTQVGAALPLDFKTYPSVPPDVGAYILDAFVAPTRDPREEVDAPILRSDVLHLEDLKPGMELQGTVRNVVDFGAFVDCGVKDDGLVHISKMSNGFIKHPLDAVSVGQIVKVWVLEVDLKKHRLQLTMIDPDAPKPQPKKEYKNKDRNPDKKQNQDKKPRNRQMK